MPNRTLMTDELEKANAPLRDIRARPHRLAGEDAALLLAYRRKIAKELGCDEPGKPIMRKLLKLNKMISRKGLCAECPKEMPKRGPELDRINAMDGYTEANTRLVHHECHVKSQEEKGFA